jgi:CheY-like chemotaxis protein
VAVWDTQAELNRNWLTGTSAFGMSTAPRRAMDAPPILALEDEPDDLQFVRRALKKAGLANPLLTATTVEQAQRLCTTNPTFVLVLLDVYLKGRSGLDFLEWLRAQPAPLGETPVVILTVSTDLAHERRASALRGSLFLGKPATEEVLADAIVAFGLVKTTVVSGGARRRWLAPRSDDARPE